MNDPKRFDVEVDLLGGESVTWHVLAADHSAAYDRARKMFDNGVKGRDPLITSVKGTS